MLRVALAVALLVPGVARAQRPLAIEVARVCYLEATFRESDCVAMWHVARKRAALARQLPLGADVDAEVIVATLDRYSAIGASNERARTVRVFPDADVDGMGAVWNMRWARLRELAREVVAGEHADPCPAAIHWGGTIDPPRGSMVPARCMGDTANVFYAVRHVLREVRR